MGMTQEELSKRAGVSRDTIENWALRSGARNPGVANLIACLNVLGLDLAVVHKR